MINLNLPESFSKLKKSSLTSMILSGIIAFFFILSVVLFIIFGYSQRRVFLFESLDDGGLWAENRYYPRIKNVDKMELYVSDLLLGPIGDRYKGVFAPGTKIKSCFVRDKTLYVDLSSEALFPGKKVSELRDGIEIFKKNVFRNFGNIDIIELFIEGNKPFDE